MHQRRLAYKQLLNRDESDTINVGQICLYTND